MFHGNRHTLHSMDFFPRTPSILAFETRLFKAAAEVRTSKESGGVYGAQGPGCIRFSAQERKPCPAAARPTCFE